MTYTHLFKLILVKLEKKEREKKTNTNTFFFLATPSKEESRPRSSYSNRPDVECGLSPATNVFTAESEKDEERHSLEKEIKFERKGTPVAK